MKADVLVVHEDAPYTENYVDTSPRVNADGISTQQPSDFDLQMEIERLTVTNYTNTLHLSVDESTNFQNNKNNKVQGPKSKSKRRRNKYVVFIISY